MMVETPLEVLPGDHVIGSIRMTRNKRWRRHIKVNLTYQVMRNDHPLSVSTIVSLLVTISGFVIIGDQHERIYIVEMIKIVNITLKFLNYCLLCVAISKLK